MAAVLKSTGFQDAVDYKVVSVTAVSTTGTQTNITNSSGTLYSVIIDSANSSANVSVHIIDSKDTANTQISFKGKTAAIKTFQLTTGYAFDELSFWVSANSGEDDTTGFAGNVDVTFVST